MREGGASALLSGPLGAPLANEACGARRARHNQAPPPPPFHHPWPGLGGFGTAPGWGGGAGEAPRGVRGARAPPPPPKRPADAFSFPSRAFPLAPTAPALAGGGPPCAASRTHPAIRTPAPKTSGGGQRGIGGAVGGGGRAQQGGAARGADFSLPTPLSAGEKKKKTYLAKEPIASGLPMPSCGLGERRAWRGDCEGGDGAGREAGGRRPASQREGVSAGAGRASFAAPRCLVSFRHQRCRLALRPRPHHHLRRTATCVTRSIRGRAGRRARWTPAHWARPGQGVDARAAPPPPPLLSRISPRPSAAEPVLCRCALFTRHSPGCPGSVRPPGVVGVGGAVGGGGARARCRERDSGRALARQGRERGFERLSAPPLSPSLSPPTPLPRPLRVWPLSRPHDPHGTHTHTHVTPVTVTHSSALSLSLLPLSSLTPRAPRPGRARPRARC